MPKPVPKEFAPSKLPHLARAVLAVDSPVRTDGFTVYVANLRSYHKTD